MKLVDLFLSLTETAGQVWKMSRISAKFLYTSMVPSAGYSFEFNYKSCRRLLSRCSEILMLFFASFRR